jgi:hypothetical protein
MRVSVGQMEEVTDVVARARAYARQREDIGSELRAERQRVQQRLHDIDSALEALGFQADDDEEAQSEDSEEPGVSYLATELQGKSVPNMIRTILQLFPSGLTAAEINQQASVVRQIEAGELHPSLYRMSKSGELVATGSHGKRTYRLATPIKRNMSRGDEEESEAESDDEEE